MSPFRKDAKMTGMESSVDVALYPRSRNSSVVSAVTAAMSDQPNTPNRTSRQAGGLGGRRLCRARGQREGSQQQGGDEAAKYHGHKDFTDFAGTVR